MLVYESYLAEVELDTKTGVIKGTVISVKNPEGRNIVFQARDMDSLQKEFEKTIRNYEDTCKRQSICPETSVSGHINVKIPLEIHALLRYLAHREEISLNKLIPELLSRQVKYQIRKLTQNKDSYESRIQA